ncbi:MAG: hypothetical protein MJZ23_01950 [Paludibacteraceae bacterium]|nr:hypothetical protein [Paludibacteraceae bacterium]
MKKKFLMVAAVVAAIGLASCNGDEIERLNSKIDTLTRENDMLKSQNQDELNTINEVMTNFAEIRQQQLGLSEQASSAEGVTEDKKEQIQENFKLIQDKFLANQAKLDSLETALKKNKGAVGALNNTIKSLRKQLTQSKAEIESLQKQLEEKNVEIADLKTAHDNQVRMMTAAKNEADSINAAKIKAQDIAMHTVAYLIDNKKNLKAKGLKVGLKKGEAKDSYCKKVDYREFEGNDGIKFKKEPTLYTYHPQSSYKIVKNADKTYTFTITNPDNFWSTKTMILEGERM